MQTAAASTVIFTAFNIFIHIFTFYSLPGAVSYKRK
jgi:hypothetical protein